MIGIVVFKNIAKLEIRDCHWVLQNALVLTNGEYFFKWARFQGEGDGVIYKENFLPQNNFIKKIVFISPYRNE